MAVVALAVPVLAAAVYMRAPSRHVEPPPPARVEAPPAAASPNGPSFDVVRVAPGGAAVLAGRAQPGARVVVTDGASTVGEAQADGRGEWVLIPAAPIPPGGRELTLVSRTPDGAELRGDTVLLVVPPAPAAGMAAAAPPTAALVLPPGGEARMLNTSDAAPRGTALALATVDYDDKGEIRFAGTARPGAAVRVYVDNAPAGDAVADPMGRWSIKPPAAVATGVHRLRVDQLAAAGRVQARVEVPFQRSSLPAADLANGRVVVQPGQTLWRMARAAYGSGVRYTVIYLANREQIRDPKLIYPGQAFAVPDGPRPP